MTNSHVTWMPVAGPNYVSADGRFYATYLSTVKGYASYMIHPTTVRKGRRQISNALRVGGLS